MKRIIILVSVILISFSASNAQLEGIHPDYLKTLQGRAGKIVDGLQLKDEDKAGKVQEIIVVQYYELSKIHEMRDLKLDEAKSLEGEKKENAKMLIQNETDSKLYKLHAAYLATLSSVITQDQVVQVKDGMTYGVFDRTYNGYLTLLPEMTYEQKIYVYRNLAEARELAMDAGSSKAKHAWFGKYKGRINNYLSAEGYDLKKAEQALMEQKKQ